MPEFYDFTTRQRIDPPGSAVLAKGQRQHDIGGMGGGGGDIPGRLDALERDVRDVRDAVQRVEAATSAIAATLKADLRDIAADLKQGKTDIVATRVEVAGIAGQIKHIPTSIQLIGFAVAVFVAAGLLNYFK